jgi:hypothetical protein
MRGKPALSAPKEGIPKADMPVSEMPTEIPKLPEAARDTVPVLERPKTPLEEKIAAGKAKKAARRQEESARLVKANEERLKKDGYELAERFSTKGKLTYKKITGDIRQWVGINSKTGAITSKDSFKGSAHFRKSFGSAESRIRAEETNLLLSSHDQLFKTNLFKPSIKTPLISTPKALRATPASKAQIGTETEWFLADCRKELGKLQQVANPSIEQYGRMRKLELILAQLA